MRNTWVGNAPSTGCVSIRPSVRPSRRPTPGSIWTPPAIWRSLSKKNLGGGSLRASPRAFHPRRVGATPPHPPPRRQTHSCSAVPRGPADLHRAHPLFPRESGSAPRHAGLLLPGPASDFTGANKRREKPISSIKLYRISFTHGKQRNNFLNLHNKSFFQRRLRLPRGVQLAQRAQGGLPRLSRGIPRNPTDFI